MNTEVFVQNLLLEANLPVTFHAFYWGEFELVNPFTEGQFQFFAKSKSTALDRRLSFQTEGVFIHLSKDDPKYICKDIASFFVRAKEHGGLKRYDARLPMTSMFTSNQMYVSPFDDPEEFEEIDAYTVLIKGIDKQFNNLLGINNIETAEKGSSKHIGFISKYGSWDIHIDKELFDIEFLHSINRLLLSKDKNADTLHLNINAEMKMVILKLDKPTLERAQRMGLIV